MATVRRGVKGNPILSETKIVDKALALLEKTPLAEFTVRKLALALRITPGALYRYFPSQDELLDAVFTRVLAGVDLSALHDALDWRETLAIWAHAYRNQQLRYPHTAQITQLRMHIPAMWFEISEPIISALARAGFSEFALMDTVRFFSRSVTGAVIMELVHDTNSPDIERGEADNVMAALSPKAQSVWKKIYPYLGDQDNDALFEFTVRRLIDAIEVTLPTATNKKSPRAKPANA